MRELHAARSALVEGRAAGQNRQKSLVLALLKRQAARLLAQVEHQLAAINAGSTRFVKLIPFCKPASTAWSVSRASAASRHSPC